MARKRTAIAPLTSISPDALADVVGGRISVRKGPSPELIQGLKNITDGVAALGQKKQADQASQGQMMQQVMQQMMGGKKGPH